MTTIASGTGLIRGFSGDRILAFPPENAPTASDSRSVSIKKNNQMSGCQDVSSVPGVWFCGHVKPSNERRLAEELSRREVDYFLPLVTRRVKKPDGRIEQGQSVLFPQYIFFAGEVAENGWCEASNVAVMSRRLCGIIPVVDQPKFVRQLRAVQLAIECDPKLGIYPRIHSGQRCRITTGAMLGTEGFCESIRENAKRCLVVLRIDLLGQSVAVERDIAEVEIVCD
jgi:transcription antitermination factor NusG